jgi:prolyl oligopeptidase
LQGFRAPLIQVFSIANAVWLENEVFMPFLICVVEVNMVKNGMMQELKCKKQNVFDDFIAAAEYLIAQNIRRPTFAIRGGSKGLLVGATMTQRPELMKVALPAVGDGHVTLPYIYCRSRLGLRLRGSQDSKEMFEYIKGYSPVQNVKAGTQYPATMVTTGDHDESSQRIVLNLLPSCKKNKRNESYI